MIDSDKSGPFYSNSGQNGEIVKKRIIGPSYDKLLRRIYHYDYVLYVPKGHTTLMNRLKSRFFSTPTSL